MRERMLLLCMTYPTPSNKYGAGVCMAGITDEGEFRRIYPVPFETFVKRKDRFHKRSFIEYEIREKGDFRKESFKVKPESIVVSSEKIPYNEIRQMCDEYSTSIEELEEAWRRDKTSLGIVKPGITNFTVKKSNEEEKTVQSQLDGCLMPEMIEYSFYYHFKCADDCKRTHKCTCLDTEIGQLFRKLKKSLSIEEIIPRMKYRFFDWMLLHRDPYFMMGTHHYHPNHWMIISLLYPEKRDLTTLSSFCVEAKS